jgi:hypothetical protein
MQASALAEPLLGGEEEPEPVVVPSEVAELGGVTVKWIPGKEQGAPAEDELQWQEAALLDAALAEEGGDFDAVASKRGGGTLFSATANLANTSALPGRLGMSPCLRSPFRSHRSRHYGAPAQL